METAINGEFHASPHYDSSSLFMLYLQLIINLQLSLVKQAVNAGVVEVMSEALPEPGSH